MNGATVFLILIIAVPVLVLTVLAIRCKINYKKQVTGKKKPKDLGDKKIVYRDTKISDFDLELLQHEANLKSGQNLFGPR